MRVDIEARDVVTKQSTMNATVDPANIFDEMKSEFVPSKDLFQ
jgi:hypothetical protein